MLPNAQLPLLLEPLLLLEINSISGFTKASDLINHLVKSHKVPYCFAKYSVSRFNDSYQNFRRS
jgi:hypothetical protein